MKEGGKATSKPPAVQLQNTGVLLIFSTNPFSDKISLSLAGWISSRSAALNALRAQPPTGSTGPTGSRCSAQTLGQGVDPELVLKNSCKYLRKVIKKRKKLEEQLRSEQ